MSETDWLDSKDPEELLRTLVTWTYSGSDASRKAIERKLRLFAASCCRQRWTLLRDPRSREAVEIVERCLDGSLSEKDRLRAAARAFDARLAWTARREELAPATRLRPFPPPTAEEQAAGLAFMLAAWDSYGAGNTAREGLQFLRAEQLGGTAFGLLRCLLGNPFRPARVDPAWRDWNQGLIRGMAEAIHEEHRFTELPVLADALEEAGCTNSDLLAHCRGPGPHARGCWVLDALTGKG